MHVHLTARAQKDLARLPAKQRLRILLALKVLAGSSLPVMAGIKRLEGANRPELYRLRVGAYRVLCTAESDVVTVLRVISRQDLAKAIRRITGR